MPAPDLIDAASILASRGGRLGKPLHLVDETVSTNDDAKRAAKEGAPHGATWVAETQTHGRGRQGRVWTSPRGENLLFSVLLRIPCSPSRVPPLALVCGLAVRDAIANALGDEGVLRRGRVRVKWPNDVVVVVADDHPGDGAGSRMKKIAGILVESSVLGSKVDSIVIGVGVNVHTRDFPPELAPIATSLSLEGAQTERAEAEGASLRATRPFPRAQMNRAEILADILSGLDRDIEHVAHRGLGLVHSRLTTHDALHGRNVESEDGSVAGVACGMDVDGRLLVRNRDGSTVKIASGEVRIRTP